MARSKNTEFDQILFYFNLIKIAERNNLFLTKEQAKKICTQMRKDWAFYTGTSYGSGTYINLALTLTGYEEYIDFKEKTLHKRQKFYEYLSQAKDKGIPIPTIKHCAEGKLEGEFGPTSKVYRKYWFNIWVDQNGLHHIYSQYYPQLIDLEHLGNLSTYNRPRHTYNRKDLFQDAG